MRPERRIDPILPVVVGTVKEAPEREAGRLAFGGSSKSGSLYRPSSPSSLGRRGRGCRSSSSRTGGASRRWREAGGAPLDLRLAVGACVLTPHVVRSARGRLAVTVRELRDFLFPHGWKRWRDWPKYSRRTNTSAKWRTNERRQDQRIRNGDVYGEAGRFLERDAGNPKEEGMLAARRMVEDGHHFEVAGLAPHLVKGGDSVPTTGVALALDWKVGSEEEGWWL